MKQVLFLSYSFPVGRSFHRSVKLAKYLPEFGWQVAAVAANPDEGRWPCGKAVDTEHGGAAVIYAGRANRVARTWKTVNSLPYIWRFGPTLRRNLQFPDRRGYWRSHALPAARKLLKSQRFDAIYSTSPPETAHWVALQLKREFGLPWFADFRDPWYWTDVMSEGQDWHIWRWRRRWDTRFERAVYTHADLVIANTPTNHARLVRKGLTEAKVVTIPNGYDEEDFVGVSPNPPRDVFRVTYTGAAYSRYTPELFLEPFRILLERVPDARVRLTFAGGSSDWADQTITDGRLRPHLELLGQLPHSAVSSLLMSSHVLVQSLPPASDYRIPLKIYEYLRSGTTILGVCDVPSELDRILSETSRGRTFRRDDVEGVADYLMQCYRRWEAGSFPPPLTPDGRVRAYERRELVGRLAEAFQCTLLHRSAVRAW